MDELVPDLDPEAPLRQGDVLGFRNWTSRPPLERYALVITADCDLAQGREDETAICVAIAPFEAWIREVWCRDEYLRELTLTLNEIAQRINTARKVFDPLSSDLSSLRIKEWLLAESAQKILDDLQVGDPKASRKLAKQVELAQQVLQTDPRSTDYFDALANCYSLRASKEAEESRAKIREKATSAAVEPDRVDTFFLTGFVGPEDRSGYLVMLSQFRTVSASSVTSSYPRFRDDASLSAYRFGRLQAPYKYSVAQRFAYLFQRIGLPDEHRDRHLVAARAVWNAPLAAEV
jgi:hypothetical protein